MQIESLKVFCDLAETESFTKAAQINSVTQSAVSQQISALERIFKSLLIERSKKKFRLTREGQVLYDYSKQIIQTYESLHSKLQELEGHHFRHHPRGDDLFHRPARPAAVHQKFMKSYPTVNVHVEYRRANQVYEDVLGNVVDMGLVAYPVKDSKLEIIPLRKEPLVLHLPSAASVRQAKSIKLKSLADRRSSASSRTSRRARRWTKS
jgi:DNA-binding transcriptional LysR family regulator